MPKTYSRKITRNTDMRLCKLRSKRMRSNRMHGGLRLRIKAEDVGSPEEEKTSKSAFRLRSEVSRT